MTSPSPAQPGPARIARLVHFALASGTFLFASVIVGRRVFGPPLNAMAGAVAALALTGVAVLTIAVSLAVMRPRLPARGSDQSPDEFWRGANTSAALVVWALIEAGGLIAVVAYYLTGLWTPLGVAPVALFAFYLTRPAAIEG